jgi:hypothetical protein
MKKLTFPASQVLDAFRNGPSPSIRSVAAALRAAVAHVFALPPCCEDCNEFGQGAWAAYIKYRDELLAIVTELEASEMIEFEPTQVTIPAATIERVMIALQAGLEAASDEHADAVIQYQERRPLRVKWYADQVELIATAIHDLHRDTCQDGEPHWPIVNDTDS